MRAWYATEPTEISMVDSNRYRTLLLRAVNAVVEPIEQHFGIMPQATTYSLFLVKKTEPSDERGCEQLGNTKIASVLDLNNSAVGL